MHIRRILRFYLVFTLVIAAGSALSYNQKIHNTFGQYYTSVVHALDDFTNKDGYKYLEENDFRNINNANLFNLERSKKYSNKNLNSNLINFKIDQNVEKSFAEPGQKEAEIMKLIFKTGKGKLIFNHMKFKIYGVNSHYLNKVYLYNEDELISEAKNNNGYFEIKNIGFKLDSASSAELIVKVDLSKKLQAHDRLRLDIENPTDIGIQVAGKAYDINEYYPIQGKYLTIVLKRGNLKN